MPLVLQTNAGRLQAFRLFRARARVPAAPNHNEGQPAAWANPDQPTLRRLHDSSETPLLIRRRPVWAAARFRHGSQTNAGLGVHPRPARVRSLDGEFYSTLSGILATLINGRARQRADDLEIAQLLRPDVHHKIFSLRVVAIEPLDRVLHGGGKLAVGAAELLEQHVADLGSGLSTRTVNMSFLTW